MNQTLLKNLTWDQIYINYPKKKVLIFDKQHKTIIAKITTNYFNKKILHQIKER